MALPERQSRPGALMNHHLLDAIKARQGLKRDADLCRLLGMAPPYLSKMRAGRVACGPAVIINVHEETGMPIAEIKELLAQQDAPPAKRPPMRRVMLAEHHATLKAQGVPMEDLAFRCPMCGTIQSGRDLIAAGAGENFEAVRKYLGFSCVGRWTKAPGPRKEPNGKPCNWTLGGLLSLHTLEVEDEDGEVHPSFEPATPEEAKAHAATHKEKGNEDVRTA